MSKYVVLDLETIYLPEKKINKIIEIGFLIIHNDKIVQKDTQLINPGEKINHFVENLTSITNKDIKSAPFFEDVYQEFIPLFKNHIIVAHQAQLDMKTINDELNLIQQNALENKTIDTVELSKILLPKEASYKLTDLAKSINIKFDAHNAHRALADAEITAHLFLMLKNKLINLPKNTLYHLQQLLPYLISDIDHFFSDLNKIDDNNEVYNYYNDLPFLKPTRFIKSKQKLIDYESFLRDVYASNGLFNKLSKQYHYREGQVEISAEINKLFNQENHGLIEAATGIGKSIGYLIPSIYQSVQTNERVVISTYTTHLQSQLMYQEIETLKEILPFSFNVQILKGRKHYLDLKRFYRFLKNKRNDTYPLVILKAKIIVWITETETGQFSDLNIEPNMEKYLFEIETLNKENPNSYYYFAYHKSSTADLILINHALLIADLNSNQKLIPDFKNLIIDEAHQFKNLIIEQENLLLSSNDFIPFIKYLISLTDYEEVKMLLNELISVSENLFNYAQLEKKEENKYLFTSNSQTIEVKHQINEDLNTIYGYIVLSINKLIKENEVEKSIINQLTNYQYKLANIIDNLKNNLSLFMTFTKIKNNIVEWFMYSQSEQSKNNLLTELYKEKKSVVYLSATLTIRDRFNYMLDKLKLSEDTYTLKLTTPFNLNGQTRLIVPTDFPSIKDEKNYLAALSELVFSINELSKGRILILFTSYEMLKATYHLLTEFLNDETLLLAQGVTHHNREQLIYEFKTKQPAILLGTASFWEGIDLKGDLLSCLVMTRLPFQHINQPIFKVEAERIKNMNQNAFFEYALPEAVLKYRQGIGRLIRNEKDRGIIFVLDNRLKTSNYKKFFVESISPIKTNYYSTKEMIEEIENWI